MMPAAPPKSFTIACVVDSHPRFRTELVLWALCISRYLSSPQIEKVVYFVGLKPEDLEDWLHGLGFETRVIETVVPGSPHSNKIAPFLDDHETDYIIVCDVDLFFVADPSHLFTSHNVRAAPNNHCNPPASIFKKLLSMTGIVQTYRPGVSLFEDAQGQRETHINNISGGIVAIPKALRPEFALTWRHWSRWLVEMEEAMGQWKDHVDQIGFCLAMERLSIDVEFLPPQINCVIEMISKVSTIYAFHLTSGHIPSYPEKFRPDRTLDLGEFPASASESLDRLNACIIQATSVIERLSSTRDHMETFLNPNWRR